MRYLTTALVVLTVVVAGCNSAGIGGTPTAAVNGTETGTAADGPTRASVDASAVPGADGSTVTDNTALLRAYYEAIQTGPTEYETTYERDGTERLGFEFRNDTRQQRYVLRTSTRQNTIYVDGDTGALRNETSGEIIYSNETNAIADAGDYLRPTYTQFTLNFIFPGEWEATDTTTVHGEEHYVLEATGLNESRVAVLPVSAESVSSMDGRLVVGADGVVHSGNVTLHGETDITLTYATRTDDGIDVTAPDWYDESQAS
ncbi:hypothetical protein [Haloarcula onubensis]|uniref:Lipoprotein n=1 Tax=Haloarcula onubensis TaxID=2950539 RepID=A0ABU2FS44_9EURY|nr:hypothetical protein [Halomicroarcula sp. S3CR25-11]MDS0283589.1 hypothetical protein [Halomicroarcula sp. S3CR25-11]